MAGSFSCSAGSFDIYYENTGSLCFAGEGIVTDRFSDTSDDTLACLAQKGSGEAMTAMMNRYTGYVWDCMTGYFLSNGNQDDLFQEGMIGLWYATLHFNPNKNAAFRTFAQRCIKGAIKNAIASSQAKKSRVLTDALQPEKKDVLPSGETGGYDGKQDPEDIVLRLDEIRRMREILFRETSAFEKKVVSYWLRGFSRREIADSLGETIKVVDNAMQRVRLKMHSRLTEAGDSKEEKL